MLSEHSFGTTALSAPELAKISDNSEVLVRYAKLLAGISAGSDQLFVDGMPASRLPPAGTIESITVNADPFSAEFSDGNNTRIEILTKSAKREFRLSGGGLSLGPPEHSSLNPNLTSGTRGINFGVTGPIPYFPIAFTTDLYLSDQRAEVPIEAVIAAVQNSPVVSANSASTNNLSGTFRFGADYSRGDTLHLNAAFSLWTLNQSNLNVSGITLPEAGESQSAAIRELRTTFRKSGPHFLYRGGLVADWVGNDVKANSSNVGINVQGAFIAGGAQIRREIDQGSRWTFKNVLEFDAAHRHWSTGAIISRMDDSRSIEPNPAGYIEFGSLADYLASATTGARAGIALITRGQGEVHYASNSVSPFIEGELLHRTRVAVRGGLRADYETSGGVLLSPRLSVVCALGGFVLRAGSGMFAQNWANDVFLQVMENDKHHLQQVLITNVSLADITTGRVVSESDLVSKVAPNLAPTMDWVSKASVERPLKNFIPGVEYTWTVGSHLLGSDRLPTATGWTDLLKSNRTLRKQQLHLRAQYKFAGQSLTAHYEWVRSFDDTDGPFSFPEIPGDLKDEWARSSGVSPHNVTIAGNFQIRGGVFINLVGSWRGSAPYNVTTGLDSEHDGLFNDRGGLPRNSGDSPAYRNLSLYASRRFRMPWMAKKWNEKLYGNLGLQAENILDNRNYLALDAVKGSPIFAQPLAALPGRSIRLSLNFSQ